MRLYRFNTLRRQRKLIGSRSTVNVTRSDIQKPEKDVEIAIWLDSPSNSKEAFLIVLSPSEAAEYAKKMIELC